MAGMTLVDSKGKKRYYVLRDTDNRPLTTANYTPGIEASKSLAFFAQFPAPPDVDHLDRPPVPRLPQLDDCDLLMNATHSRTQRAGVRAAVTVVAGVLAIGCMTTSSALADDSPYPSASAPPPVKVDGTDPDLKLPAGRHARRPQGARHQVGRRGPRWRGAS